MKRFLLSLFILSVAGYNCAHGMKRKVLFIGNSYIAVNNIPVMVQSIATAMGDTLEFDQNVPGGFTFQGHSADATTITKIFSQPWDIVVLQEQSQRPAFSPSQVASEVYPYARRLDSMVHANDSCSQTMFLMTWGRANGDASNCAFYPPICTYWGMQQRLRESYMEMAVTNNALVAPVGMAWKVMRDSAYTPWLYSADSSHPSIEGSYLEACVLYSSIFHKKTLNCTFTSGLSATDAYRLQRIASKVVFDSLALWQGNGAYPYAGFTHSGSGPAITFTSQSPTTSSYAWTFGDGNSGTAANPVHSYTAVGVYTVTNTVSTDCFTETFQDTVRVTTIVSGIGATPQQQAINVAYGANGTVTFILAGTDYHQLEVYNTAGEAIKRYTTNGKDITDELPTGFYIIRAITAGGHTATGKINVIR